MFSKLLLTLIFFTSTVYADDENSPIHLNIHYMAQDLIDDLVYEWLENPPFNAETLVSLVEVSGPIGLDHGFVQSVENRLFQLLKVNPHTQIKLSYCSICMQYIAKANPEKTVFSRVIDQPEALEYLSKAYPSRKALSLQFEAEGKDLVLRASIFELTQDQKIVWANSFNTVFTARRLLREDSPLKSQTMARDEQMKILSRKDPMEFVTRISFRSFDANPSGLPSTFNAVAPLIFLEQSFEGIKLPDQDLRLALDIGFTSIQNAYEGWLVGGHVANLLLRKTPSLMNPDIYFIAGFHFIRLRGPGALVFGSQQLDINQILNTKAEPKASMVGWKWGFETHIKHRFGAFTVLEYYPVLKKSKIVETSRILSVPYQSIGAGMVIRW